MVKRKQHERGSMIIELVMALGILVVILLPLGFSFVDEQHVCRVYYWRAVALEVVDGGNGNPCCGRVAVFCRRHDTVHRPRRVRKKPAARQIRPSLCTVLIYAWNGSLRNPISARLSRVRRRDDEIGTRLLTT